MLSKWDADRESENWCNNVRPICIKWRRMRMKLSITSMTSCKIMKIKAVSSYPTRVWSCCASAEWEICWTLMRFLLTVTLFAFTPLTTSVILVFILLITSIFGGITISSWQPQHRFSSHSFTSFWMFCTSECRIELVLQTPFCVTSQTKLPGSFVSSCAPHLHDHTFF